MTAEELQQLKRQLLKELPQALALDTEFALMIEGMLSERFPRRDEFARLLDEVSATRQEMNERFERVDQRFEQVRRDIEGLKDWMQINAGGFQTKAGKRLEDVVAGAFRYGLKRNDILPENVKLRQEVIDEKGVVFRPGKSREIDIIAVGDGLIVFEVKSTADADDIDDLADKVTLVRHLNPDKSIEGVLVMLGAEREHRDLCKEKGLTLIP